MGRKNLIQKKRRLFSIITGGALCVLVLFSQSRWEGRSLFSDILFVTGLVLIGVATVGRLWCSLYICGYKTGTLITEGPYSICRNPLYFFSLLGGMGVGFASETLTITGIIITAFLLYYPFVIRAEETRLRRTHGEEYENYVRKTPRFFPNISGLIEPEEYPVRPRVFRRAVFDALWFVWLAGILEFIEALHEYKAIEPVFRLY